MTSKSYIILLATLMLGFSFHCCTSQKTKLAVTNPDEFSITPKGTYEQRKKAYLQYAAHYGENGDKALQRVFPQIARVANSDSVQNESLLKVLDVIYSNTDCNDFSINGLLRLSYMDKQKPIYDAQMGKKIEDCILDFKYWWDEARRDTTYRCYHTENHQALYHTAELLAGQLYKDKTFTSGMTGAQHMQHAIQRLEPWLEYRFRFGFSEWLSTYYEVDIMLLANLHDFAEDEKIRNRAARVLDVLMYDLALHNFHGVLPSTSGRMYSSSLTTGVHNMSTTLKLVFGEGQYLPGVLMSNTSLALSTYECPQIIKDIATDYSKDLSTKQRLSINVEDAPLYGLSHDSELNTHLFWGMQEFIHPQVVRMSKQMSQKYKTYPYGDKAYDSYIKKYDEQIAQHGKIVNPHLDRFALSEANIETYRTEEYMLSTAIDFRKGATAYQQHIWQAALDRFAVVFTNYPGSVNPIKGSPNYWAGSEVLPRSTQSKNVAITIYDIPEHKQFDFTHAYFPKDRFDEVVEKGSWIFGRKGDAYVALKSQNPTEWKTDKDGIVNDVVAKGRQNIWVCEMGRKKEWETFKKFVDALSSTSITFNGLTVDYTSPSQGQMTFGWTEPFIIGGKEIPLRGEYRYDNPYSKTKFDSKVITIENKGKTLTLDYNSGKRTEK